MASEVGGEQREWHPKAKGGSFKEKVVNYGVGEINETDLKTDHCVRQYEGH